MTVLAHSEMPSPFAALSIAFNSEGVTDSQNRALPTPSAGCYFAGAGCERQRIVDKLE